MPKLDDFFKKRLENEDEAPDGWNVPSELPWEAAKPHFPKPKKKKRFLLWIPAGTSVLLVIAAIGYMDFYNADNINVVLNKTAEIDINENGNLNENENKSKNEINNLNGDKNGIINENKNKSLVVSNVELKKNTTENLLITSYAEKTTTSLEPIKEASKSEIKSVNTSKVNKPIPPIQSITSVTFILSNEDALLPAVTFPKIMPEKKRHRFREVGIAHKLGPFSIDKLDFTDGMDQLLFRPDYSNINLQYTQSLGKRWSISTGLALTSIDAGLDFVGFFNYDSSMINESISSAYETGVKSATSKVSRQVDIRFFPGLEPAEGELLNAKGSLNLKRDFIQIPLMINYRWIRPKMEYHLGTGINFGFYKAEELDVAVAIYRDDTIISEQPQLDDLVSKSIDVTPIIQTGFKRKITPNIKLGINTTYDVAIPLNSGIEIGAFYRWNK